MLRSITFASLLALSVSAHAEDFSYSFVTVSYGQTDIDDIDVDGDAIGLTGSFEVGESFYVFGGYSTGDLGDDFGNSVDVDQLAAGLGHHLSLSDAVDLVSEVSYQYIDISVPGFGSVDDNGFGLGVGLRFAASEAFELNGGISYVDFGDGGDDTGFGGGVLYNINDAFTVGLNGTWTDDSSTYSVGGRYYFGN